MENIKFNTLTLFLNGTIWEQSKPPTINISVECQRFTLGGYQSRIDEVS